MQNSCNHGLPCESDWKPASQGVLLDYISQWNVLALFQSLGSRHIVATLAILGSLLLKLLTVLSTGLLVLQNIDVTRDDVPLVATEAFGVADQSFGGNQTTNAGFVPDFRPTTVVLAMAKDNLTLPKGTTLQKSFQQFAQLEKSANHVLSLQATVDVFESVLNCEPATFNAGWVLAYIDCCDSYTPYYNATSVFSGSCKNATLMAEQYSDHFWMLNTFELHSSFSVVRCAKSESDEDENDMRMLFYMTHFDRTARHRVLNSTFPNSSAKVTNSANITDFASVALSPRLFALMCFPKYDLYRTPVSIDKDGKGTVIPSPIRGGSRSIDRFSAWH